MFDGGNLMSVYVCGDTHNRYDISKLSSGNWPIGKELTKNDALVILGDFGFIWGAKFDSSDKYWLNWLCDKPFNVYFIDGNHENFDRLFSKEFPVEYDSFAGDFVSIIAKTRSGTVKYLHRGRCYNFGTNYKFLTFGGGQSIDQKQREPNVSWWQQEVPSIEDITRLNRTLNFNQFDFDFILTHAIPYSILKRCEKLEINNYYVKLYKYNKVEKFLDSLMDMITFDKWFCGHYHIDYSIDDTFYLCYNNEPIKVC